MVGVNYGCNLLILEFSLKCFTYGSLLMRGCFGIIFFLQVDVWALGVCVFQLMTFENPFKKVQLDPLLAAGKVRN